MIVLVDTDVILDVALGRVPHADASGRLLDWYQERSSGAFIAWHTASNVYYLLAGTRSRASARRFLVELTQFVGVAPTSSEAFQFAAELPMGDLEDAMQVAAARAAGADVIATRNVRDFAKSPIPALSPAAILRKLTG